MEPTHPSTEIRYLASTLTLVSGYYAIRSTLPLTRIRGLFVNLNSELPTTLSSMILYHPHSYLVVVLIVFLATLVIIWTNHKYRCRIYPVGICLLFFLAERAIAAAFNPIFRMIDTMGNQ